MAASTSWSRKPRPRGWLRAGNIGGELLNWIAMLGVVGDRKPVFIAPEIEHGHAYAAWRLD